MTSEEKMPKKSQKNSKIKGKRKRSYHSDLLVNCEISGVGVFDNEVSNADFLASEDNTVLADDSNSSSKGRMKDLLRVI